MPKYLTEDKYRGRVRVKEPETCAICKEYTHNLNYLWHDFLCSDECEAEYGKQYEQSEKIYWARYHGRGSYERGL